MSKVLLDCKVVSKVFVNTTCFKLWLTAGQQLPELLPGQFVEVRVDGSSHVFLRRPISIHDVDKAQNSFALLINCVGEGTRTLSLLEKDDVVNILLPLGNGFSPVKASDKLLLVGGGVGVAPLLYTGRYFAAMGAKVSFLLGFKSVKEMIDLSAYATLGAVSVTTEDGSEGVKGFVTAHPLLSQSFDRILCCGPTPMMKAVATVAAKAQTECEVSLENKMACGLGACLCCVTQTKEGHKCVCTDGPVFNTKALLWQI